MILYTEKITEPAQWPLRGLTALMHVGQQNARRTETLLKREKGRLLKHVLP